MREALVCAAIDPSIGGVLIYGDRGTGKSTAVRALADLLPKSPVIPGCVYRCDPRQPTRWCDDCRSSYGGSKAPPEVQAPVGVVDLPLGATEDRVVGSLDVERALSHGERRFEPGLLAAANGGFLYVDEVNLLEDHLVDLLLDVAASGENRVEREGLSVRHPARFVLVGSGNPEEGELRPQLLDRFGLCVDVRTPEAIDDRVSIIRRRDEFEQDPAAFGKRYARKQSALRTRIRKAQDTLDRVEIADQALARIAGLCAALGTDGLRGELTLMRAARALAAYQGASQVTVDHIRAMAEAALAHRLRRDPLDDTRAAVRVQKILDEQLGP
jgi:magnesium chelatase subunit I